MSSKLEASVGDNGSTMVKISVDGTKNKDEFIAGTLSLVMLVLSGLETEYDITIEKSLRSMRKVQKISSYIEEMIVK